MKTKMTDLGTVVEEIEAVEALLQRELGDAVEGCSLLESVALLVSQRENARNAHAATQGWRGELEAALRAVLYHYAPDALSLEDWAFEGNSTTDAVLRKAREALNRSK